MVTMLMVTMVMSLKMMIQNDHDKTMMEEYE